MDDDGVASLEREVLLLQRALHIIDCDLVSVAEHLNALVASDINQHAACDKGGGVFDAELGEACSRRDLISLEAVVVTIPVTLVSEAVELHPDLADLRQHHLLVATALVRLRVHDCTLQCISKRRMPKNGMPATCVGH